MPMRPEPGIAQQLREAARTRLPERAFLRRDRGDAFLISNAPIFEPDIRDIPGFTAFIRGRMLHLYPDESWIARVEAQYPEPPDHLCAGLARFRGERADADNMLIFTRCIKLLDAGEAASDEEWISCGRALRQQAAVALRGGCGGGLYAAAILIHQYNTLYKGEEHT